MTRHNSRTYKKIGAFTLTQPEMFISDPGYDKDTWCAKLVKNCKTGTWEAYININKYVFSLPGDTVCDDRRVASVFIRHESVAKDIFGTIHLTEEGKGAYIRWSGDWENLSDNIGVDSGQAGFFDYTKFGDNSLFETEGKCGFGDKWYSNCCDATLEDFAGIVAGCGINSSSGFGDGCYTAWGHKTSNEYDAMVLFFLPDNERIGE